MSIFERPGLHTDVQTSKDLKRLAALGFEWIVYQAQNDSQTKNRDLTDAKAAGLKAGVWGVSYHQAQLEQDARRLRERAFTLGAELIVNNIEFVHDPTPYIEVFKNVPAPKALICLVGELPSLAQNGAIKKLLDAGWDIIGETYTNDQSHLTVAVAEDMAVRISGIPKARFSHALGMYHGLAGTYNGFQYVQDLYDAAVNNRFSAWMVEHGTDEDYEDLARAITPAQTPLEELMEKLNLTNTGVNAALNGVEKLFDAAGVPEPDGVDALRAYLLQVGAKINEIVDEVNSIRAGR